MSRVLARYNEAGIDQFSITKGAIVYRLLVKVSPRGLNGTPFVPSRCFNEGFGPLSVKLRGYRAVVVFPTMSNFMNKSVATNVVRAIGYGRLALCLSVKAGNRVTLKGNSECIYYTATTKPTFRNTRVRLNVPTSGKTISGM